MSTASMNENQYGFPIVFSTGFDMSAWTALTLTLTPPPGGGSPLIRTNPQVSIAGTPRNTPIGQLPANTYALYTLVNNDISMAGTWTARLTFFDGTQLLISNPDTFTVTP